MRNVVAVAGGGYHSLALKSDGTVVAWGYNGNGQTHVPVSSNNVEVMAGDFHSLALQNDGTVVAWGDNGYGQTHVPAGLSSVVAVAAGGYHSLALRSDGTVVAWGQYYNGLTYAPMFVPGGLSNVVGLAAGGYHNLALKSDGTVVAWGDNGYGQNNVPVGLSNVVAVAEGGYHSLALKSDGTVVAWGQYYNGLTYAPMFVPGGLSNVVGLAAGGYHSLALVGNRTPVAVPQTTNGVPNTYLTIQLSGSDADGDSLRFKISVLPSTGRLFQYSDANADNFGEEIITNNAWVTWVTNSVARVVFSNTIISSFNIPGATFQFVANDGVIDSAPATVTVNITNTIPTVANLPVILVNKASALLMGTVNPNGLPTSLWFEWGTTTNYGLSANSNKVIGSTWQTVSNQVSGFVTNQIYHYRVCASNVAGAAYGKDQTFIFLTPSITTSAATLINGTTAVLNGSATPNGLPTQAWFEWGFDTDYGTTTALFDTGSGTNGVVGTNQLTGLTPGRTYHFRLAATNDVGINYSADMSFVILSPTSATLPATSITVSNAVLNGMLVANTFPVTAAWFEWGTNLNYGNTNLAFTYPNGATVIWVTNLFTNLAPYQVYHFRLVGSNSVAGPIYGGDREFAVARKVVAWGDNGNAQTNVPAGLSNLVAVAGGDFYSLALKSDGTVVAWGYNGYSQTNVPGFVSNMVAVAVGVSNSLAIKRDGTVVAWGDNGYGQTNVPAGLNSVVAVAAGDFHSLALESNGTLVAWGYNGNGQTNVPVGLSNVVAVAAGEGHSVALKSDGTLAVWGQYFNGSTYFPVYVPAGLSKVVAVAGGGNHSLALKSDGTVIAWGDNSHGQTNVPAGLSNVVAVAGGRFHSLALKSDGTVIAWGDNGYGQANVPAGLSNVVALAGGGVYSLALVANNSAPLVNSQTISQPHDRTTTITLSASDADGDLLSLRISRLPETDAGNIYQYTSGPLGKAISDTNTPLANTSGMIFFVPQTNSLKVATFEFTANDGLSESVAATVTVNITNHAPSATSQTTNGVPGTNLIIQLSGTDVDGDSLAFKISTIPGNGHLFQYSANGSDGVGDPISTNNTWVSDPLHQVVFQAATDLSVSTIFEFVANDRLTDSVPAKETVTIAYIKPDVTTSPAELVARGSVWLKATVNPNGASTTSWFEWGTTTNYGFSTNLDKVMGSTTLQTVSNLVLAPETNRVYHYRVAASNVVGTNYGLDQTFIFITPSNTTREATLINGTTAVLNGSTTPNGLPTQAWFEWGTDTNYNDTTITLSDAVNGTNDVTVTKQLAGLTPGQIYHFRLAATNDVGTNYGADMSFVIFSPCAATLPATSIIGSSAALNGMLVANTFPVTAAWFEWGTSLTYGKQAAVSGEFSGGNVIRVTKSIHGLVPYQSYHFRLAASNSVGGVAYGGDQVFAVGKRVVAWGDNRYGQTNMPVGLSNVVAVAGGWYHSLALKSDGTVAGWGYNGNGQTNVPVGLSNVVAVAAGGNHSLALKSDGTVNSWGYNNYGQTSVPVDLTNAVAVAGGENHSLALMSDGTVAAWGDISSGQTIVPVGLSNVVAVAAGGSHSLALKSDGTVVAWGATNNGQTKVPVGLRNVVAVAAGGFHSLALQSNGTVAAWGSTNNGQTKVPVGLSNVVAVAAGVSNSLALKSDGTVVAWGANGSGQTNVPVGLSNVVAVAEGWYHSLALVANNTAPVATSSTISGVPNTDLIIRLSGTDADGDSLYYKIGDKPSAGSLYQYSATGRGDVILTSYTQVTDPEGRVIFAPDTNAYGANNYATFQFVANDGLTDSAVATITINIVGTAPDVMSLPSALVTGTSAMLLGMVNPNNLPTDAWFEWGTNSAYGNSNAPVGVGSGTTVVSLANLITNLVQYQSCHFRLAASNSVGVAHGWDQVFAVGKKVVAWGDNSSGQTNVSVGLSNVVAVAAGVSNSLALKSDGTVAAWGDNSYGQTNIPVGLRNVMAVAGGGNHSLALKSDGTVVAWGYNGSGQTNVPNALNNVVVVAVGGNHSLALKSDGTVVAWGDNSYGQTNVPVGLSNVVAVAGGGITVWRSGATGRWSLGETIPMGRPM